MIGAEVIGQPAGRRIRIATIMDHFTHEAFRHECDLVQLRPDDWARQLAEAEPDLLFVESAWRGVDDLWTNRLATVEPEVAAIVSWCRERSIPTAFWNKEDPVHFNGFLNTAALFDVVFTTDIDSIQRYVEFLGHERIFVLPFGVQPKTFNPLDAGDRMDAFSFAGAYYVRYPDRAKDLRQMVDELTLLRPFLIYDRNHGQADPNYAFPPEYQPFILGHLPYEKIDRAYKGYRYTINLNSVTQSQTMCARRIFELLASGSTTISNFSRAVRVLFGDLAITSSSASEIARRVEPLIDDDIQRRKFALAGVRKVLAAHTYEHRLAYVLSKTFRSRIRPPEPKIHVIAPIGSLRDVEMTLDRLGAQKTHPTSLTFVTTSEMSDAVSDAVSVAESNVLLSVVADADANALPEDGYVAVMVPEDHYGANYLTDLALSVRYTNAHILGKAAFFDAEHDIRLVSEDLAYTVGAEVASRRAIAHVNALSPQTIQETARGARTETHSGPDVVAIDEFNYCANALGSDQDLISERVDDLRDLDCGWELDTLTNVAESILTTPAPASADPRLSMRDFADWFDEAKDAAINLASEGVGIRVSSNLASGTFRYLWSGKNITTDTFQSRPDAPLHISVGPGIQAQVAFRFFDETGKKVGSAVSASNTNSVTTIPSAAVVFEPGVRVAGPGSGVIEEVLLGHKTLDPPTVLLKAEHLVVTDNYPTYDNLYRKRIRAPSGSRL